MNLYLLQQYQFIQNLYNNENYIDILMNIDDFFDILNVYAFENWEDCEVIEMKIMKHYTNIILKQEENKMPNPKAGKVLTNYNCKVKYKKTMETRPVYDVDTDTFLSKTNDNGSVKLNIEKKPIWLIDILIPNNMIINDDVYDLESIQEKLNNEEEQSENMESLVDNEEDMAVDMQQNAGGK